MKNIFIRLQTLTFVPALIISLVIPSPMLYGDIIWRGGGGGISQTAADARYIKLDGTNTPTTGTVTLGGTLAAASQAISFSGGSTVKNITTNVVGIVNSTNQQSLYVANTDDGAGNAEYLRIGTSVVGANRFGIQPVVTGTGAVRPFDIYGASGSSLNFGIGSTPTVSLSASAVVSGSSGARDLGSTANLWRSLFLETSIQGGEAKTLTETSATAFVQVDVASGASVAGNISYEIFASDATDHQSRSGELYFSVVNKAGTETCTLFRAQGSTTVDNTTDGVAVSAGTLTNTFTCTTTPANGVLINANATSSLAQTTLRITYRTDITSGTATVTPQ